MDMVVAELRGVKHLISADLEYMELIEVLADEVVVVGVLRPLRASQSSPEDTHAVHIMLVG